MRILVQTVRFRVLDHLVPILGFQILTDAAVQRAVFLAFLGITHRYTEHTFHLFVAHELLDTPDGDDRFGKLGNSLREEDGHRSPEDVVVRGDGEGFLRRDKVAQQGVRNQADEDRHSRREHDEGQQGTSDVRDVADDFDFLPGRSEKRGIRVKLNKVHFS